MNTGQPVKSTLHQLGRAKVSDGKSVVVTVPASTTIKSGEFVLLGGFFGAALANVTTEAGESQDLVLSIEQAEYETDQITAAQAFARGTAIYWDDTTKKLTETATNNRLVGRVTLAKDANNVILFVLGPQV